MVFHRHKIHSIDEVYAIVPVSVVRLQIHALNRKLMPIQSFDIPVYFCLGYIRVDKNGFDLIE